jgi:transcription elongation factor/antiterminator RfaH
MGRRTPCSSTGGLLVQDPGWYLIKTKPLNENKVNTRLTGAGFETLYPRMFKRNRRKRSTDIRPLFPTYLFVRFPLDDIQTIRYTRGVARIVSFGSEPQTVGEEIIQAIQARMDGSGVVQLVASPIRLKPGQKIRIEEGPFEGFEAVFVEELPDRERVVLLLEAVSSFRVTLPKDALGRP